MKREFPRPFGRFAQAVFEESSARDPTITHGNVKEWLEKQRTYTLYRPAYRKFKRLKTAPSGLDSEWQADLAMMNRLQEHNEAFLYFLVVIEVLSRKMYAEPVMDKRRPEMIRAFKAIIERAGTTPLRLFTDAGGEFKSPQIKAFYKDRQIVPYPSPCR